MKLQKLTNASEGNSCNSNGQRFETTTTSVTGCICTVKSLVAMSDVDAV